MENTLKERIFDESNGLHYTLHGDYYLPNFELPPQKEIYIGNYGRMRETYLKNHRKGFYTYL